MSQHICQNITSDESILTASHISHNSYAANSTCESIEIILQRSIGVFFYIRFWVTYNFLNTWLQAQNMLCTYLHACYNYYATNWLPFSIGESKNSEAAVLKRGSQHSTLVFCNKKFFAAYISIILLGCIVAHFINEKDELGLCQQVLCFLPYISASLSVIIPTNVTITLFGSSIATPLLTIAA